MGEQLTAFAGVAIVFGLEWDPQQGRYVRRDGEPNEELLRQGARSRASGWYLEP